MKNHLTERELIKYQFKLAPDTRMKETAEHLQGCGECREHLEKLQRKFAALDLLRGEAKISEDLISRVIEQTQSAQGGVRTKIVWFKKYAWLNSAAAVLVVGVLLLATQLSKDGTKERGVAKGPMPAEEMELASKPEITSAEGLDKDAVRKTTLAMATKEKVADRYAAFDETAADAISEEPPFAPASAIELVTLPRREKVQLTIYNSADLTLVRERRNLTLKKGWNWLQFMWANTLIDPTSLSLEPLAQADKIDIQQLVFPARLRELGRWLIRSEVSGQVPFEITYFTSGLSWRAFYMGTLAENEKTMQLQGYVRVGNNSGEDYEKAQTRLIVGKVHILDQIAELAKRQYPYNRPVQFDDYAGWGMEAKPDDERLGAKLFFSYADKLDTKLRRKKIRKEGLSEYFLYTIEGTETIPDKWGKRLLSFEAADIEVEGLYKYDEQRWGNQTIRFVKFANDEDHNLGETPIPNGTVKIYSQADEQGYLSYVGGTNIKYIPVNEEVELNLGPARLVSVEPKLMDFKTENYIFDRRGNIAGWDEIRTWKIEITNTRALPIEIEITRGFGTAYWTMQVDIPFEKHDATHARFKVNLEPRSKSTFEYTVTTYHGVREETLAEKN